MQPVVMVSLEAGQVIRTEAVRKAPSLARTWTHRSGRSRLRVPISTLRTRSSGVAERAVPKEVLRDYT